MRRLFPALAAGAVLLTALPAMPAKAAPAMVDSGLDYTETTETLGMPGAGYTSTVWYVAKPGDTPVKDPTGNIVLMFVDIGAFSSGVNGTTVTNDDGTKTYTPGTDYDLDESFFAGMRGTLENCRRNGCTVAFRFRYDANGKTEPEPATFDQVLRHIDQIREDGFLEDYKDILMFVESGFVGAWGEQHSGKYTSLPYKAQLLQAVLDMVPDDIPVTVRTPNIFREWQGLDMDGMAAWTSEPGTDAARVGLYNDGYMGSDSDLGTYSDRAVEAAWIGRQAVTSYYGGEFSGNLEWAQKYDTYLPENAIPEMYQTHLSYINANIWSLYQDYTFSAAYDVDGVDNSAYYGQTVYKFMRDHLGYRFVVRDCDLSAEAVQGGTFDMTFAVENTGFAAPIRPQKAELLLEKDGVYLVTDAALDTRDWRSCTTTEETLHVDLPGALTPGDWHVCLRFSVGDSGVRDGALRTVRFANPDIYDPLLGANVMGTLHVTASDDAVQCADQTFSVNGLPGTTPSLWRKNAGGCVFDGATSSDEEWPDAAAIGENGDCRLWLGADEQYLYVAARAPHGVEKPVWNLRMEHDGQSYWCYWQSAGWMYYSGGDDHSGIQFKKTDDFAEFRIKREKFDVSPETVFDKIRVFVQDEGDEWKLVGDVTAEAVAAPTGFGIFNAPQTVTLLEDAPYTIQAAAVPEGCTVTWYRDGVTVGTGDVLTLPAVRAADKGVYTARFISPSGMTAEAEVCTVADVIASSGRIRGDVDADGDVDVQDVILLTRWLLGDTVPVPGDADMDADGVWDVLDLGLLKRAVLR